MEGYLEVMFKLKPTCPSAMITRIWNWPPLFSTIFMAAFTTGA